MMNKVHKLYFDIETWGGPNKPTIEDIEAPSNYKDPEKILAYKQEKLKDAWAKQALDVLKGEIICLCYAVDNEETIKIIGTEKEIIERLDEAAVELDYIHWIGYNILGFDIPWLHLRSIKYGAKYLRATLPTSRSDNSVTDIMQKASSTLYGKDSYMSQKDIAKFFGLESKTDMDGSMVHDAYVNGEIDRIASYCAEDVETVRKLYKLITE
jgi:predicted PolB exonuclease-like 3'-5' exonuclease